MAKADKTGNDKIPKRIAGVKIPKQLRKSGRVVAQWSKTPIARELLASGLVAVAAALASNKRVRDAAKSAGKDARDAASSAADGANRMGMALAAAATDAAHRLFPAEEGAGTPRRSGAKRKSGGGAKRKAARTRTTTTPPSPH